MNIQIMLQDNFHKNIIVNNRLLSHFSNYIDIFYLIFEYKCYNIHIGGLDKDFRRVFVAWTLLTYLL
ncbi:Uncharacterised protein [Peptostreptococcus anaerobius]|uniref:Uncharacterized protein n=1 Tax=Peptostreptococcus anaerobius TaxID=1261 RepID=A0A379CIX6_9FIRM|nr:unknown [Peptostreptococcus anaerobius CAG:621]SFM81086.1 hypothetical protein SAMN05660467_00489 [Peptostreptococcus anaerobius]SUB61969.1 Uncharacterised protein [Peptostreptococcus anaerobius]